MPNTPHDVTALLSGVSAGNRDSWEKLLSLVYRELHTLAHDAMWKAGPGQTLQTTALVNEAYLRLVKDKDERWKNRGHFFSVAARAMRQIVVDQYRKKKAVKRGEGQRPLPLEEALVVQDHTQDGDFFIDNLKAVDRALDKLGSHEDNKRKCTIVELHFFVGLTLREVAEVMGVSKATVMRDWEITRAWLYNEIKEML